MKEKRASLVQAELAIAYLLRYGVLLCGLVLAIGLGLLLFQSAAQPAADSFLRQAQNDPQAAARLVPRSLEALRAALAAGEANAIIALGLLLLIALPIARVGATVVVFLLDRDAIYFAITLFVFSVLIAGILLGKTL